MHKIVECEVASGLQTVCSCSPHKLLHWSFLGCDGAFGRSCFEFIAVVALMC